MSHCSADLYYMKTLGFLRVSVVIFFILTAFAVQANAQQVFEFFSGVRQNGMGGAYTATVNDETAILVNPAALGKIRDATVTIVDPEISIGSGTGRTFTTSNYSKAASFKPQNILTEMNAKASTGPVHLKAQIFPSIILENFGFGLHYKQEHDSFTNEARTNYSIRYVNDFALALGYNFRFFGGILKLGLGAKLIDRTEVDTTVPVATTDLNVETYGAEGSGISAVTGIIVTAPVQLLPTISAVVQDVGGTSFNISDGLFNRVGNRRPKFVTQKVDAGVSFSPIISKHIRMSLTGEVRDITNMSAQQDKSKLYHAGAEINFADFFFLRGGMNQRYYTGGAEFATEQFQLQVATYGEEVGTYPAKKEDRRYVFKFTMRF